MTKILNFSQLSSTQIDQYRDAVTLAFPAVIGESAVIKTNWAHLEAYFPEYQFYMISDNGEVIGFMNTVPFYFDRPLEDLPQEGWDWMFVQGVEGYRKGQQPKYLGGLQVIVRSEYQGLGYSQQILKSVKQFVNASPLENIVIPIRPTGKHEYPKMPMSRYMVLQDGNRLHDPWIRTHVKNGAKVIKVCERSMTIRGDVKMWERLLDDEIITSGQYFLDGALTPIQINVEDNIGEYIEPNIWIAYD